MSVSRPPFWSRAVTAGVAGCLACCAPPIAALVLGAGAATALTAYLEPLAGVFLGAAAIVTVAVVIRRRRAAACAIDRSCGCTLTPAAFVERAEELRALEQQVERQDGQLRWTVRAPAGHTAILDFFERLA